MPYRIRKRRCQQSDGTRGEYVIEKRNFRGWTQVSCHESESDAEDAKRIREQAESSE